MLKDQPVCQASQSDRSRRIWDREARQWAQKPDADFQNDPLICLMRQKGALLPESTFLDVGCGSGRYSVVLARGAKLVVGCDASAEMIRAARQRALDAGLSNVRFESVAWDSFYCEELFDVVFAHRTGAIDSVEDIDRMTRSSRRWCFYTVFLQRENKAVTAAREAAGLAGEPQYARHVCRVLDYLIEKGFFPHISYRTEIRSKSMPAQEAVEWCLNRLRLRAQLTAEQEAQASCAVRRLAHDGMLDMTQRAVLADIDWRTDKAQ